MGALRANMDILITGLDVCHFLNENAISLILQYGILEKLLKSIDFWQCCQMQNWDLSQDLATLAFEAIVDKVECKSDITSNHKHSHNANTFQIIFQKFIFQKFIFQKFISLFKTPFSEPRRCCNSWKFLRKSWWVQWRTTNWFSTAFSTTGFRTATATTTTPEGGIRTKVLQLATRGRICRTVGTTTTTTN